MKYLLIIILYPLAIFLFVCMGTFWWILYFIWDYKAALKLGSYLVGKKAQSRLLTMLTGHGKQVLQPAQKITAFEIVETFMEPTVMVTIGGEQIFEDCLFNIH